MSNTVSFSNYATDRLPKINEMINEVFKAEATNAKTLGKDYQMLHRELHKLVRRGGKRLRPLLFLLAYEGYGQKSSKAIKQIAVTHELVHAFLLIHDDVIDRDYYRWGGPNIIGVFFDKYDRFMEPRDALHAAEGQALLAGDMCLALATRVLSQSNITAAPRVMELFQNTVLQVIAGELTDMSHSKNVTLPTQEEVLNMYVNKTASYSFNLPLVSAALCANAQADIPHLEQLANNLGIAYQVQDDILGTFGTQQVTGKPVGGDLKENKPTILLLKALELSSLTERKALQTILAKKELSKADIAAAQVIMRDSGALQYTQQLAASHLQKAQQSLMQTSMREEQKALLGSFIESLQNRLV